MLCFSGFELYSRWVPLSTKQKIEGKTVRMDEEARRVGLKINMEKTTI